MPGAPFVAFDRSVRSDARSPERSFMLLVVWHLEATTCKDALRASKKLQASNLVAMASKLLPSKCSTATRTPLPTRRSNSLVFVHIFRDKNYHLRRSESS